jgi:molecular chaperone DnaJ
VPSKSLDIGCLVLSNKPSSSNPGSPSEAPKNEGFLKSLWHNLTDHPKDGTSQDNTSSTDTSGKDSRKDEKSKDKNEPKKASGTGD